MKRVQLGSIALVVLALLLGACSSKDEGGASDTAGASTTVASATYSDNGVSFEYPGTWKEFTQTDAVEAGNKLWGVSYGPAESEGGAGTANFVAVQSYQLNQEVTADNLPQLKGSVEGFVKQLVEQGGGQIDSGPTEMTMGGIDGYSFEISGVDVGDIETSSRLVLVFQGDIEYFVNCQYAGDAESEILNGCDQVVDSFAVDAS